jgi:uncharacterized protein (UPF0218 family)
LVVPAAEINRSPKDHRRIQVKVQDDEDLAALAAACLNCDPLDVMIIHAKE